MTTNIIYTYTINKCIHLKTLSQSVSQSPTWQAYDNIHIVMQIWRVIYSEGLTESLFAPPWDFMSHTPISCVFEHLATWSLCLIICGLGVQRTQHQRVPADGRVHGLCVSQSSLSIMWHCPLKPHLAWIWDLVIIRDNVHQGISASFQGRSFMIRWARVNVIYA